MYTDCWRVGNVVESSREIRIFMRERTKCSGMELPARSLTECRGWNEQIESGVGIIALQ